MKAKNLIRALEIIESIKPKGGDENIKFEYECLLIGDIDWSMSKELEWELEEIGFRQDEESGQWAYGGL